MEGSSSRDRASLSMCQINATQVTGPERRAAVMARPRRFSHLADMTLHNQLSDGDDFRRGNDLADWLAQSPAKIVGIITGTVLIVQANTNI